jgi:hypothetical protein
MSKNVLIDILSAGNSATARDASMPEFMGALMPDTPETVIQAAGGTVPTGPSDARAILVGANTDGITEALTAIITALSGPDEYISYADRARWALAIVQGGPVHGTDPEPWTSTAFGGLVDLLMGRNATWSKASAMANVLMDAMHPVLTIQRSALQGRFMVPTRLLHRITVTAGERGIDTTALAPFPSEGNPDWFIAHEGPYTAAEVEAFIRLERARWGTREVTYPEALDAMRMHATVCALAHATGASAHAVRLSELITEAEGLVATSCEGPDVDMESYQFVELAHAALAIGARDRANALVDRALTYGNSAPYNTPPLADALVTLGRFNDLPAVVAAASTWWGGVKAWCIAVKGTHGRADMVTALRASVMHTPEEFAALTGDALCEAARNLTSAAEGLLDAGVDAADLIATAQALMDRMVAEGHEDLELVQPDVAVLLARTGAQGPAEAVVAAIADADARNEVWLEVAEAAASAGARAEVEQAMGRIDNPDTAYRCALKMAEAMPAEADAWLAAAATHAMRIPNERDRINALYRVIALRRDAGLPTADATAVLVEQCANNSTDPELSESKAWMLIDVGALEAGLAFARNAPDTLSMRLTVADALLDAGGIDRIASLYTR